MYIKTILYYKAKVPAKVPICVPKANIIKRKL